MFIRQKKDYIQKVTINFGTLIGEAKDEDAYIVLKEMNTMQTMELNDAHDKGEIELMNFFREALPELIVDHNLYETETVKMNNNQITDLIFEKLELTSKVISEYTDAVFASRLNKTEE